MSGKSRTKPLNRLEKQKRKSEQQQSLESIKLQSQKQEAQTQIQMLSKTGIVDAYSSFLKNICTFGLPEPRNVYEMAAQHVLKFERQQKIKEEEKKLMKDYNYSVVKESNTPKAEIGKKSWRGKFES